MLPSELFRRTAEHIADAIEEVHLQGRVMNCAVFCCVSLAHMYNEIKFVEEGCTDSTEFIGCSDIERGFCYPEFAELFKPTDIERGISGFTVWFHTLDIVHSDTPYEDVNNWRIIALLTMAEMYEQDGR